TEHGLSLLLGLQIAVAGFGAWRLAEGVKSRRLLPLGAAVGVTACLFLPRWNHLHLSRSKYHRFQPIIPSLVQHRLLESLVRGSGILEHREQGELLYYGEGVGGFTPVVRTADALGNPEIALANSGKFDASSVGDMKTQVLLAHVPMLLHPRPEQVMVLGL